MPILPRNLSVADRIQIIHQGAVLNLERRGRMWCLAQAGGYPVRPELAQRLTDQLLALRLTHPSAAASPSPRLDDPADASATGVRVLAASGASLGAIIVSVHSAGAQRFLAHQAGDPRDWQAEGALDVATDPMAWVDTAIMPGDPATNGAHISHGAEAFDLDAAAAQGQMAALHALTFTAIRPAAQLNFAEAGRATFALPAGGTLTVSVLEQRWERPPSMWESRDGCCFAPEHWPFCSIRQAAA